MTQKEIEEKIDKWLGIMVFINTIYYGGYVIVLAWSMVSFFQGWVLPYPYDIIILPILFIFHLCFNNSIWLYTYVVDKLYISQNKKLSEGVFKRHAVILGIGMSVFLACSIFLTIGTFPLYGLFFISSILSPFSTFIWIARMKGKEFGTGKENKIIVRWSAWYEEK
ncbi:MAG: hypothetical protein QW620_05990 [Thermoplasmata archaeon]